MLSPISREVRFNRLLRWVGAEGLARLEKTTATVVGIGAVGSFAAEALARSGVGHLRLVDFDTFEPSNINRQLFALESTLGLRKVDVARQRILDINPECWVETLHLLVEEESVGKVFQEPLGVVLDAIDILSGKAALVTEALRRGVPIVASMGAARRKDPAQVRCGPLEQVSGCPLARSLRRELKSRGLEESAANIPSVYSIEKPMPLAPETLSPQESQLKAPLPSTIMVTGCFGLNLANLALKEILQS